MSFLCCSAKNVAKSVESVGDALNFDFLENVENLKYFGHLEGDGKIPSFIDDLFSYILRSKKVAAVFRVSGNTQRVGRYINSIESGKEVDLEKEMDPHSAGTVIKFYISKLPKPLFPFELLTNQMKTELHKSRKLSKSSRLKMKDEVLGKLEGPAYRKLLRKVLNFIREYSKFRKETEMDLIQLCIRLGNLILKKEDQGKNSEGVTPLEISVPFLKELTIYQDKYFPDE